MIRDLGDRIEVTGNMTLPAARTLLQEGSSHITRADAVFDLAGVEDVDSSGLAVVFGWQRAAKGLGRNVRIVNPPANLRSLAEVYGVSELLPL